MKAQMFNYSEWVKDTDAAFLKTKYRKKLYQAGFSIISYTEEHFKPFGYTGLWLLGESHFAIHTFPEEGKSYIEITSCIKEPFEKFIKLIK